jgi:hypothetical protein
MSIRRLAIMVAAGLLAVAPLPAQAQKVNRLTCQGHFQGAQAMIIGMRHFTPTSAMGDGYVRFQGEIGVGNIRGGMAYEGYTATGAFTGQINAPQGSIRIGVLDNTGGRMIIYGGQASLGPPTTLGEFRCQWQ